MEDGAWEVQFEESEAHLRAVWVEEILANLEAVLRGGHPFTVLEKYGEVFGDLVGVARSMHLRAAWKRAFDAGLVENTPRGVRDLLSTPIVPA